jgi:hypothetical protein
MRYSEGVPDDINAVDSELGRGKLPEQAKTGRKE